MKTPLAASLLCALFAPSAAAQLVVPSSSYRAVSGDVKVYGPLQTLEDDDLERSANSGVFQEAASVTIGPFSALASGGATQDSLLTDTSLSAKGGMFDNSESYVTGWDAVSSGRSSIVYRFTLTAAARFTYAGDLAAYDDGFAYTYFSSGPTVLVQEETEGPSELRTFAHSGLLAPGDHTLTIQAHGNSYAYPFEFRYASANFDLDFNLEPAAGNYCVGAPNSAGSGAQISSGGSHSIQQDDFTLRATGSVPSTWGLFFYGPAQAQTPLGDGFLCVAGATFRLPAKQADGTGSIEHDLDFTSGPPSTGPGAILPGSTWNFQYWYRETQNPGGAGFNLSDGLWAEFGA